MARLPLKPSVVKRLFALSGNQCSYPNCKEKIVNNDGTVIGEICHIEAAEPNGERYNINSTDEFRRSFENLILLCSNHHKATDNVIEYSVEKLISFKSKHENNFVDNSYEVTESIIEQAIDKYMEQNNSNYGSGNQFSNLADVQNIGAQVGTQNNYYSKEKKELNIDGARKINYDLKQIIDQFKQKASPPSTEVIDFKNELAERFERPVELIPTKFLRFRKGNGRIIAEVESFEKENNTTLNEEDTFTQELLRKFLLANDKEKNKELKSLLIQKGQQRPAIITCDGFLINGNRRKMTLEELYLEKNEDSKFEMMRVVILPEGVTELDIQKIENRYQLQSEGKSEYQGLNRAIKIKRNIENGFSLEAQLKDDPNFHDLPYKEFEKKVKEFEKNYLKPLECVDRYLSTFNRVGLYNTISEGSGDKEGRWQAFIDYSNLYTGTLKNKVCLEKLKINENEIGKIENAIFKVIRKRSLNASDLESSIGKVHDFVRKVPKYLNNPEAKKYILKIADDAKEDIPNDLKFNKDGSKIDERDIDEKWGNYYKKEILGNLIQAHKFVISQNERDKPLELLEDALKKLNHDNLKIENMDTSYFDKAFDLTIQIIDKADIIFKSIDKARYEFKKLSKKGH